MLQLIPPPLHRQLIRLAHQGRRWWWTVRRPLVFGCRAVAFDGEGRVLLIRHSYGSWGWMPPGGGVRRGEAALVAAQRELREEVGCTLEDALVLGQFDQILFGATNRVHVVAGRAVGEPCADRREVLQAAFFALDRLPEPMTAEMRGQLLEWGRLYEATAG